MASISHTRNFFQLVFETCLLPSHPHAANHWSIYLFVSFKGFTPWPWEKVAPWPWLPWSFWFMLIKGNTKQKGLISWWEWAMKKLSWFLREIFSLINFIVRTISGTRTSSHQEAPLLTRPVAASTSAELSFPGSRHYCGRWDLVRDMLWNSHLYLWQF